MRLIRLNDCLNITGLKCFRHIETYNDNVKETMLVIICIMIRDKGMGREENQRSSGLRSLKGI